jgi:hypothetical protein
MAIAAIATVPAAAACNALNGGHERILDVPDASAPQGRDAGDVPIDAPVTVEDAGADTGPGSLIVIEVSKLFTSLNGATFMTTSAGTTITAYDAGATHPVIVPTPQPTIPSEDFTVLATVKAPTNGEFGILTRVQASGAAVVFGSKFGNVNQPFLGTFGPPDWNPTDGPRALAYSYTANARYSFKVQASSNKITAKMWNAATPEPADSAAAVLAGPYTTGRGIGFYTYDINGAVLESMRVTVP